MIPLIYGAAAAAPVIAGAAARFAPSLARMVTGGTRVAPALSQPVAQLSVASRNPSSVRKLQQEERYQAPNLSGVPADAGAAIPDVGQSASTSQSSQQGGSVIPDMKTGASDTRKNQSLANMIGRGWSDISTKPASSALKSLSGDMGMLSKARDAYLRAALERKAAKENAITGNKQLIDRYQTKDLRNLGSQLRAKTLNTNMALGAAGSGSAGLAAARALARENAVSRSNVLTEYGDEISAQNQQQALVEPEYQSERKKAYEWEDRNKRTLLENFNIQKQALDRLKSKVPEWKRADLENENTENLKNLMQGLANIEASARSYRDNLYGTYYGMEDEASSLSDANLGIQGPAELATPEYSPELDMSGLEEGEYDTTDYYRPTSKLKKKQGRSIFDNPLIFEEEGA